MTSYYTTPSGTQISVTGGTSRYATFGSTVGTVLADKQTKMAACYAYRFCIHVSTYTLDVPPTVVVQKNGVDTLLTLLPLAANSWYEVELGGLNPPVSFAKGDLLSIKIDASLGVGTIIISDWSIDFLE
jgi:hypothetical protein